MKKIAALLVVSLCLLNSQVFPQTLCEPQKPDREAVSPTGSLEKYVYKTYLDDDGDEKRLNIGVVRPADGLSSKKRPLVIGVHSGGFIDYCSPAPCYLKYSKNILTPNFVRQGFMTASVEYRLTSVFGFLASRVGDKKLRETQYKAVQDVRAAVKYIFENADKLGVDAENVFLVGTSAGAITVLHAAYLDNEEAPKDLLEKYGRLEKRENIRGVVSLSGALTDLNYLAGGDKVPLMVVHGRNDFIVPYEKGFYLRLRHLTPVFGGKAVYDEAVKNGIPAQGFFYDFGHDYPERSREEIFRKANEFIRGNLKCSDREKSAAAGA